MRIVAFLFIIISFWQCTEGVEREPQYTGPSESVLLMNFTGHLIRRSGTLCGEGVDVEFEITTDRATDTYLYMSNTFSEIPLKAVPGEDVTIRAYELVDGARGNLLVQKTAKFDPPDDSDSFVRPEIVLCPKDDIRLYDFN